MARARVRKILLAAGVVAVALLASSAGRSDTSFITFDARTEPKLKCHPDLPESECDPISKPGWPLSSALGVAGIQPDGVYPTLLIESSNPFSIENSLSFDPCGNPFSVTWSPDGSELAFAVLNFGGNPGTSSFYGESIICVADLEGSASSLFVSEPWNISPESLSSVPILF